MSQSSFDTMKQKEWNIIQNVFVAEYQKNHTMHLKHEGSAGNFRSCLHMQSRLERLSSFPISDQPHKKKQQESPSIPKELKIMVSNKSNIQK